MPHPSWQRFFDSQSYLLGEIETQLNGQATNPSRANWFRAFDQPAGDIKVLILGQDPYPNQQHATGLAFSVPSSCQPLPKSLQNIFKELAADTGAPLRTMGDLSDWQAQGVWLLNRTLTTAVGESDVHKDVGWRAFTLHATRFVSELPGNRVAILWGNPARSLAPELKNWKVIESPHPSPLSAHRGFFGSRPFSAANQHLLATNQTPIQWG